MTQPPNFEADSDPSQDGLIEVIRDFIAYIPPTSEPLHAFPELQAESIARAAARKAAASAGVLALPPGPLGWFTILPELIAIWKIQAQMVADIAGTYGKQALLTREQMLYCLFRHAAAQAVRDVVVRIGERFLVRRATVQTMRRISEMIGIRLSQRLIGRAVSRWLPVVGALGVAGYADYDTNQVARTSIELFGRVIDIDPEPSDIVYQA